MYSDSTFDAILNSVRDKLLKSIDELAPETCVITINPDAAALPVSQELYCTVSPTSGSFDESLFDGGGREQTSLEGGIVVKCFSMLQLDQPGQDSVMLIDRSRGVMRKLHEILAALAGFMPVSADGLDTLARNPLIPATYAFSHDGRRWGAVEVAFRLSFDWDLPASPGAIL